MIEQDTIRLLRECDAGIKMGISSIDDVLGYVKSERLKKDLEDNKDEHKKLDRDLQELLDQYHDDGKEPNPMAKGMSWLKTNMKLVMDKSVCLLLVVCEMRTLLQTLLQKVAIWG